jgi:hypothetical protein
MDKFDLFFTSVCILTIVVSSILGAWALLTMMTL